MYVAKEQILKKNTYPVRGTLKKTLPGSYYQVLVALSYIFTALEEKIPFDIMLELQGVGALDDVVLVYFDTTRQHETKRFFLQQKHAVDDSEELDYSDLKNKSGKCEIFRYFDDWYLFIRNKSYPPIDTWCIYYTNRDFCQELKKSGEFVKSSDGYKFSDTFFQNDDKDSLYNEILGMIHENSCICKKQLVEQASGYKIEANPTYKAAKEYYDKGGKQLTQQKAITEINEFLQNHYRMFVGKQNVDQLEKTVADQVKKYFPIYADLQAVFNALIVETWQWFRTLEKAEVWTETIIKKRLDDFKIMYKKLEQQIGSSLTELEQHDNMVSKIERPEVLKTINAIITGENSIASLVGESGVGKSTQIADYILHESPLKLGEYLYFASAQRFLKEYEELLTVDYLKIFIVDNIKQDSKELQNAIAKIKEKAKKRLVILSCSEIVGVSSKQIPVLSKIEILKFLEQCNKKQHVIVIGGKNIFLKDILECGDGGLFRRMCYPKSLVQLCSYTGPSPTDSIVTIPAIASPYHSSVQNTFKPIELNAERVLPLYSIANVLKLSAFKGSKCVIFEKFEELCQLKSKEATSEDYVWLELNVSDGQKLKINVKQFLLEQLIDKDRSRFESGQLVILLVVKLEGFSKWSEEKMHNLLEIPNFMVFISQPFSFVAPKTNTFYLRKQDKDYYLEYKSDMLSNLPSGSAQITRSLVDSMQQSLKKDMFSAQNVLIIAVGGAGKSTSLKMLYNEHECSTSLTWANKYYYLVYVPLNKLANLNLKNLLEVVIHFLDTPQDNEEVIQALKDDLENKRILFLLDAWDEINKGERDIIKNLLEFFSKYQHIIVTTRPGKQDDLFFNPTVTYQLQTLSKQQTEKFFISYFHSEKHTEIARTFIDQGITYLSKSENKQALEIIGLPLQCYLLCEAWCPVFDAYCQGDQQDALPWETMPILSRVGLYQLFVVSRLRKTLFDQYKMDKQSTLKLPEEICSLGSICLTYLQQAAYQHLFRGKTLKLGDDWLGQEINRIGLIAKDEFLHKTYAEYFAALYLVNLLTTDQNKVRMIIFEYRYQRNYSLIFEFMAGIVSYGDPSIPRSQFYLGDFWKLLLQEPRDRIGLVDRELITACYTASEKLALTTIFDTKTLHVLVFRNTTPATVSDVAEPSDIIVDADVEFVEPEYLFPYEKYADNIRALPVEMYNFAQKKLALDWLLKTMKNTRGFRVKEACAEKLGALGIATDEVINTLTKFIVSKEEPRSLVKEKVVKTLIELGVDLTSLELGDENFATVMRKFLESTLSQSDFNWLQRQKLSDTQLDNLFIELKHVSFSIQQSVIEILVHSYSNFIISKAQEIIQRHNAEHSLVCCLLYILLQNKHYSCDDYFSYIFKLQYNDVGFDIIIGLLEPIKTLLADESIAKNYKDKWIDKIYDFACQATEKHQQKNTISKLIVELTTLNIQSERMEALLAKFLSEDADHNFWDNDAVLPCLPYLYRYFNQSLADYLVYKICDTSIPLAIDTMLDLKYMDYLIDDQARVLMIKACFKVYVKQTSKHKKDQEKYSNLQKNPAYYIKQFILELVCPIVFHELTESAIYFLQDYLKMANYALTLDDKQVCIHTSVGIGNVELTKEQLQLLNETLVSDQLCLRVNAIIQSQSRSPSPAFFLLEYPRQLFDSSTSKKKRPFSVMTDSTSCGEVEEVSAESSEAKSTISRNGTNTYQKTLVTPNKQDYVDHNRRGQMEEPLLEEYQGNIGADVEYPIKKNKCTFQEKIFERNLVADDGDCGFTAFGITREYAIKLLLDNIISNPKVSDLLKQPLREVMFQSKFSNYLVQQQGDFLNYVMIFNAYTEAQINNDIAAQSVLHKQLEHYLNDANFLQSYIHYDVRDRNVDAGWAHPAVLQALAEIQNLRLNIFTEGATDSLIPHEFYPTYPPNEDVREEVNLLFINGNHFERLELSMIYNDNQPTMRDSKRAANRLHPS